MTQIRSWEPIIFRKMEGKKRIKIKLPKDTERDIINCTASFVAKFGMEFETIMIEKKKQVEKHFRFLFDVDSKDHKYYRWKIWSLLMGDSNAKWSNKPFQMIENGPVWMPPHCKSKLKSHRLIQKDVLQRVRTNSRFDRVGNKDIIYIEEQQKKPTTASLFVKDLIKRPFNYKPLNKEDRQQFITLLRQIVPTKKNIRRGMIFCLERAEMAVEVVEIITEALSTGNKTKDKKLARLFLINDILYNSQHSTVKNASAFPTEFKKFLPTIMKNMNILSETLKEEERTMFDTKVIKTLQGWKTWAIFTLPFLTRIRAMFTKKNIKEITR